MSFVRNALSVYIFFCDWTIRNSRHTLREHIFITLDEVITVNFFVFEETHEVVGKVK